MRIQLAVAAVPLSIARPYVKGWNRFGIGVQAVRRTMPKGTRGYNKGYRLYLPIKPGKRPKVVVPKFIDRAISSAGYRVEDYITGIAVDMAGKRRIKIGKLLKDEELRNQFANDPQRAAFKNDYVCVISAHPYDVIGMSTGRRWDDTSCMRLAQPGVRGGAFQSTVRHDVAEGTLVAYAISPNDKNINKPHGRLLIKPFYDEHRNILFRVETTVYGTPVPGFVETVQRWLKKVNKDAAQGIYKIADGLYDDGVGEAFINVDVDKKSDAELLDYWRKSDHADRRMLMRSDIRWAKPAILLTIENNQDDLDGLSYALATVLTRSHILYDQPTSKKIAKIIDEVMPEDVAQQLMLEMLSHGGEKVVRYSTKLKAAADTYYAYDPNKKLRLSVAVQYAAYDPRFLGNVESLTSDDARGISGLARSFIRGSSKDTKEFRRSKMEGSKLLRRTLAVIAAALMKIPKSHKDKGEHIEKMARWFKTDEFYDAQVWKVLQTRALGMVSRSIDISSGNLAVGLCALDDSWPRQINELVESTEYIEESPEAMQNVCNCRNTAAQGQLIVKLQAGGYIRDPGWLREHSYIIGLLETIVKDEDGEWDGTRVQIMAKRSLEKLRESRQQMEDIFNELKDAGFDDEEDDENGLFDDED